jgi:5-methylcytosine-specific restriction endonuclease McrA
MHTCKFCSAPFTRNPRAKRPQVYCTPRCAQKAWLSVPANRERAREVQRESQKQMRKRNSPAALPARICTDCGKQFQPKRKVHLYCCPDCKVRAQDKRYRARLERARFRHRAPRPPCEACGSKHKIHSHHVIPRSAGGADDGTNLVYLCETCHIAVHRSSLYRLEYKGPPGRAAFVDLVKMLL